MAQAVVNQVHTTHEDTGTGASFTVSPNSALTAGRTLILFISVFNAGVTVTNVSDGVNTWSLIPSASVVNGVGSWHVYAYKALSCAAGTPTVTVTASGNCFFNLTLIEVANGADTAGANTVNDNVL